MTYMDKKFFETYAKQIGIPKVLAHKIIDGRYKPYLSNIDSQYYSGANLYDAKLEALQRAVDIHGLDETIKKLKKVK